MTINRWPVPSQSLLVAFALMLSGVGGPPVEAQSALPGYGPSTGHYRLVSTVKQTQTQMGQTQEFETATNQLLTLVVAKSSAALTLSMTVDSASATTNAPVPAPDMNAMIGANVSGPMGTDGHMATSTVTDKAGKPMDASTAAGMRSFLPRIKAGATPGAMWTDTIMTNGLQNGANVSTTTIINFTMVGDTTVAGVRGWKLTSTNAGTIDGTGNQGGADYTIKGTITGQSAMVIGLGGVFMGGSIANTVKMMVDVPMASMQIPITQLSTTTISRVP